MSIIHLPRVRRAFTLVELLIVIGIIALLIAILLPALNAARAQAKLVVCSSNMRQLAVAWSMYLNDNQGKMVGSACARDYDWITPNYAPGDTGVRQGALFRYTRSTALYRCPADESAFAWSYSISNVLNGVDSIPWLPNSVRLKVTDIKRTTETMLMVEEHDPRYSANGGSWLTCPGAYSVFVEGDWVPNWHGRKVNVSFVDAHVETWRLDQPESTHVEIGQTITAANVDRARLWNAFSNPLR